MAKPLRQTCKHSAMATVNNRRWLIFASKILSVLLDRLTTVWSHFLYMQSQAAENEVLPLPTTPCYPAPGRRLVIIKNETQSATPGVFLSFDGIVPPTSSNQPTAYKRHSSLAPLSRMEANYADSSSPTTPEDTGSVKKKWGLLGKILPFASPDNKPTPPANSSANSSENSLGNDTTRPSSRHSKSKKPAEPTHRTFSFKF